MSDAARIVEELKSALEDRASEFELALIVASVINPDSVPRALEIQFSELVAPLVRGPAVSGSMCLEFFLALGFGQDLPAAHELAHSNLGWVMSNRVGLPIATGVLLIEAARRSGLRAHGVNFPGHFLIEVEGELIDPVKVSRLSPAQLQSDQQGAAVLAKQLRPASPREVALRMLNNIKAYHLSQRDLPAAIVVIEAQIALSGEEIGWVAAFEFELGELWRALGVYSMARAAFERCADLSDLAELRNKAQARLKQLGAKQETLH